MPLFPSKEADWSGHIPTGEFMEHSVYFGNWSQEWHLIHAGNIPSQKSKMDASVVAVSIVSQHLHIAAHCMIVCALKHKTTCVQVDDCTVLSVWLFNVTLNRPSDNKQCTALHWLRADEGSSQIELQAWAFWGSSDFQAWNSDFRGHFWWHSQPFTWKIRLLRCHITHH